MCFVGLVDPGLCGRIEVHAHRSFVNGIDRHALQTQFPPSAIELRNGPQLWLPSFQSASTTAAAANPSATPINGLMPATQNETLQSCALPFPLVGDDFRPSDPPPDGLAVVSSDCALSGQALFITIQ